MKTPKRKLSPILKHQGRQLIYKDCATCGYGWWHVLHNGIPAAECDLCEWEKRRDAKVAELEATK